MKVLMIVCLLVSGQLAAQDLEAVTDWSNRVELTTLASGMVGRVNVAVGATVSRGELLLELDQRRFKTKLAAAESRLEAATQQNSEAKRELDRALELYDRTLLSDHERKQAEIEAATADATYREAEAKLATTRLQREYSRITAPFDGLVEIIHVQPGQAVVNRFNATPLVTLIDNNGMKAIAEFDQRTAPQLKMGMPVKVGIRGQWLNGEIARLGIRPVVQDANGPRYSLEVAFTPQAGMQLRAGEKAVVRLNLDSAVDR